MLLRYQGISMLKLGLPQLRCALEGKLFAFVNSTIIENSRDGG